MPVSRLRGFARSVVIVSLLLAWPSTAIAQGATRADGGAFDVPPLLRAIDLPSLASDGLSPPDPMVIGDRHRQHGPAAFHLPAVRETVELVSTLEMSTPAA